LDKKVIEDKVSSRREKAVAALNQPKIIESKGASNAQIQSLNCDLNGQLGQASLDRPARPFRFCFLGNDHTHTRIAGE